MKKIKLLSLFGAFPIITSVCMTTTCCDEKHDNITISASQSFIAVGSRIKIDSSKQISEIDWKIDKPDLVIIDMNGYLMGMSEGVVSISAISKDGSIESNRLEFTIVNNPVISLPTKSLPKNSSVNISFDTSLYYKDDSFIWYYDQTKISIDPDTLTIVGLENGTTEIYVESKQHSGIISNKIQLKVVDSANDFETDSWEVLSAYSSLGLNKLKEGYSDWLSLHNNTFVGAIRNVTIYGIEQPVVVIGEQQDYTDFEHNNPVCLTFQFVHVLSKSNEKIVCKFAINEDEQYNYWISTIHNRLNNEFYDDLINGTPELFDHIKNVDRYANTYNFGNAEWEITHNFEKLFILNYKDLHAKDGLLPHYTYWQTRDDDDFRKKTDIILGESQFWWYNNISMSKTDKHPWFGSVTTSGGFASYNGDNNFCVVPCFCI